MRNFPAVVYYFVCLSLAAPVSASDTAPKIQSAENYVLVAPSDRAPRRPGPLDPLDEIAALESVQVALSEVADGENYIWYRRHGRLSGLVRPTHSFKDAGGRICRHIVIILNGINLDGKTEGIACRLPNGIWQLEG